MVKELDYDDSFEEPEIEIYGYSSNTFFLYLTAAALLVCGLIAFVLVLVGAIQ